MARSKSFLRTHLRKTVGVSLIGMMLLAGCSSETEDASPTTSPDETTEPANEETDDADEAGEDSTATEGAEAGASSLVRVGTLGVYPALEPFTTALERGYFDDANIEVEVTTVRGDPECIRAVFADSLDLCMATVDNAIRGYDAGADVRVLAGLAQPSVHALVGTSDVSSFEDLRGKALAVVGEQDGSTLATLALLEANGIERSDVDLITVGGTSARFAALEGGQVAAAPLSQPADFMAIDEGMSLLGHTSEAVPQLTTVVGPINNDEATDDAFERFMGALAEAATWLTDESNKDDVIAHWAEVFDMSDEYATQTYELYIEELENIHPSVQPDEAVLDDFLGLIYGEERGERSPSDYIDTRYVDDLE